MWENLKLFENSKINGKKSEKSIGLYLIWAIIVYVIHKYVREDENIYTYINRSI